MTTATPIRPSRPLVVPVAPLGEDGEQRRISRFLAVVTLVLLASRLEITQGVTLGHAAALALLPMWWPALRLYRGARALVVIGFVAIGSGLWLAGYSSIDHSVSRGVLVQNVALLLGILVGVGVVVWARTLMKDWQIGLWFGFGLVLAVSPGAGQFDVNPWKFGFALPVAIVLLSLVAWRRWRAAEVVTLLALAGASAVNDARSSFAILALAALVTAGQSGRLREGARRSPLVMTVVILTLGLAIYNVGLSLVLEGYLGESTQQRSIEQIERSGSIILGARPELAATAALMAERPIGLGPGVAVTLDEILVAKTGLAAINYDPDNGYVERYMFGPRTELHSVFGDLWIAFGLVGLGLSAVLLYLLVRNLAVGVAGKTASALLVYASCLSLWNFFFGPLSTSAPVLVLAIGLGAQRLTDRKLTGEEPPPVQLPRPGTVTTAP